LLYIHK